MKTKVFLDLEETIITNWNDAILMMDNVSHIRSFLNNLDGFDGTVSIFSFAIYNDADKLVFETQMKHMIEYTLGVTVTEWPSIEEMAGWSQRLTGVRWLDSDTMGGLDIHEFIALKGKAGAFDDVCLFRECDKGTRCILIDDVVPDRVTHFKKRNLTLELVRVASL